MGGSTGPPDGEWAWTEEDSLVQGPSGPRDCAHRRGGGWWEWVPPGHAVQESVLDSLQRPVPGGRRGSSGLWHLDVLLTRQRPTCRIVSCPRVPVGRVGTRVFCHAAVGISEEDSWFNLLQNEEGVYHVHAPLLNTNS